MNGKQLIALCVSAVFVFGGICGGGQPDPCEFDVLACQANLYDFALDPNCDLSGELEIEVGQGEVVYAPFAEDQVPDVHFGTQGGQHLFVALRVLNAEIERYDKLLVRFGAYRECAIGESCWSPVDGVFECTEAEADPDSGKCEDTLGERTAVLGSAKPLRLDGDVIEEHGLLLILEQWPVWGGTGVIRVVILDPCEQQGIAEHTFPGESLSIFDTGAPR